MIKDKLSEYRTQMNEKFPDPEKRSVVAAAEILSQSKKGSVKGSPEKPKQEVKKPEPLSYIAPSIHEQKNEDSSDDSVIIDQEKDNFTHEIPFMKGSPLPLKVSTMLRDDAI